MKIDKRLELEMRGKKCDQVCELNLDNCRINTDDELCVLTSDFSALESLSMINSNIDSLKNFPELPNLRKLELSDNRISGDLDKLQGCAKLQQLSLSGNKIKDFKDIESLKSLRCLKSLDLFNCEVTNNEDYRAKVFEILDQITYLDGFDRDDNEAEEDSEGEDGEEDDEEEDEEDDDEDVEDEEGEEVGLDYLQKDNLDEDEDEDDFDPDVDEDDEQQVDGAEGEEDEEDEDEDEEDDDEEEDDSNQQFRGQKRKHDEEDDEED